MSSARFFAQSDWPFTLTPKAVPEVGAWLLVGVVGLVAIMFVLLELIDADHIRSQSPDNDLPRSGQHGDASNSVGQVIVTLGRMIHDVFAA
jgi:hypothetical protein